ncbi:unnamed protein product [Lasius platythorax]|uniref:Peptidase aspartic putative domain-containing protein n=1 Tax=Lasius platythorax TaxID=488582 RepID=A0AAV2NHG3_9HYME
MLQNTYVGWIVGGEYVTRVNQVKASACHLVTIPELNDKIEKFWRTEEVEIIRSKTKEEEFCEEQFLRTHKRDAQGRFQVELSKRTEIILGNSFDGALKRLLSLEKRLARQPDVKLGYIQFMQDYEASGHMSICKTEPEKMMTEHFYLPHQPVIKETSLTIKLRVFDASAKTSLGTSLNDKLLPGPNLQNDNVKILLRFRMHKYVLTADIARMFRQIDVVE